MVGSGVLGLFIYTSWSLVDLIDFSVLFPKDEKSIFCLKINEDIKKKMLEELIDKLDPGNVKIIMTVKIAGNFSLNDTKLRFFETFSKLNQSINQSIKRFNRMYSSRIIWTPFQEQYARLQQLQRDQKIRPSSPVNKTSTSPQSGSLNDLKRHQQQASASVQSKMNGMDIYATPNSKPLFHHQMNITNGTMDAKTIYETDIL